MKPIASRLRYVTRLLLMGLAFCLFISTTVVTGERIYPVSQPETEAIERVSTVEGSDVSMTKEPLCNGENLCPSSPAKGVTEACRDVAIKFKDRYTVCSRAVDKGCLITGLTETRK